MNEATCVEAEELLPAYVLSALGEEEMCGLATHLAECRRHDAELQAYRSTLNRLADLTNDVPPPEPLRDQLLRRFDEAVAGQEPQQQPFRHVGNFWRRPTFAYALAAAFLILAVGLGAWGLGRGGEREIIVAAASQADSSLRVVYVAEEKVAVMEIGLPPLPANQAYQAWKVTKAGAVSLGVVTNQGRVAIDVDLSDAVAVALSIEPAGGSAAPTSSPILVASF